MELELKTQLQLNYDLLYRLTGYVYVESLHLK